MLVNHARTQAADAHRRFALMRRLLKRLPEPALLICDGRIACANGAARQLFGLRKAALLGNSPSILFHADSMEEVGQQLSVSNADPWSWQASEQKIVRADGTTRFVDAAAASIFEGDSTTQMLVMHDVTERHSTRHGLLQSQSDLRRIAAGRDLAQEDERRRIAQELHNELMQSLAAMRMELMAISAQLAPHQSAVRGLLLKVGEMALAAIDSTRRIVNQLKPPMLEDLGLEAALEMLLANVARRSRMQCGFRVVGIPADRSDQEVASTCMYRVLEECVDHIERQGRAKHVEVRLEHWADGRMVLIVHDDGASFFSDPEDDVAAVGFIGMKERLIALGGTLTLESDELRGCLVTAMIPRSARFSPVGENRAGTRLQTDVTRTDPVSPLDRIRKKSFLEAQGRSVDS